VRQLVIKVLNIIDTRCNHEVYWCSNMFRFTRKPSSGSHNRYL